MPNLESKIRNILSGKKVALAEGTSLLDQDGSGVLAPGHVKPEWEKLGDAPTHPHDSLPDYEKGVTDKEAALPSTHPTPGVGTVDGDGKTWDSTGNHVRNEEKDKEDEDKKDDDKGDDKKDEDKEDKKPPFMKEDAKSENDRQYAKIKDGEREQKHVKGQAADPDKAYDHGKVPDALSEEDDDDYDQDKGDDEKKDMAEDVNALFAGEKLTEAFKKKASTIYETAVRTRVKAIVAKKHAALQERFDVEVKAIQESLSKKVDSYLNYVVEQWVEENTVAVDTGIKSDLTEDFILGLKELFTEHYIEIPQDKVNVVEALAEKIDQLEEQLSKQIEKGVKLQEQNADFEKEKILTEACKGLNASQTDKLRQLAENVDYKSGETFKESLQTLKESAFVKPANGTGKDLTEDVKGPLPQDSQKAISPDMKPIMEALKRSAG